MKHTAVRKYFAKQYELPTCKSRDEGEILKVSQIFRLAEPWQYTSSGGCSHILRIEMVGVDVKKIPRRLLFVGLAVQQ
jgi:hypothetical protein